MALDLYQEPESKWIGLLRKYWSKALMAILVLATILVWGERLFGKKHVNSRQDYLLASQVFQRFQRGELIDLESLLSCEGIVRNHPELKSYENMLAFCFFSQNDVGKAVSYASNALKRNHRELPTPYADYARATLLIAEAKLDEALEISKNLNAEEGSILEAFNLIRLAMLGEKESWVKLRAHRRFDLIAPLFQEGSVSLESLHPLPSVGNHAT